MAHLTKCSREFCLNRLSAVLFSVILLLALGQKALAQPGVVPASDTSAEPDDLNQVRKLRSSVASEIHLLARDLLDELVFGWKQEPPLGKPANVLVVSVSAPVGLGSGLAVDLENHLFRLLLANPGAGLSPVHCASCRALTTVSTKEQTVWARGYQFPQVLDGAVRDLAIEALLFIDIEAEGPDLVARSRLVQTKAPHLIIQARSVSSATTGTAMLRQPYPLKSREEAEREYLAILRRESVFFFPVRVVYRDYKGNESARPGSGGGALALGTVTPFVWFELGFESFFTQARIWFGGISVGYTTLEQVHEGFNFGGRLGRLLFAERRSLLVPDLYGFIGGTVFSIEGNNAVSFRKDPPPLSQILGDLQGNRPKAAWGAWRFGLEARVKDRFSVATFFEGSPTYNNHPNIGSYLETPILDFQAYGVEVGFWF